MNEEKEVALGAIFKNEFEYILEWVSYHRLLGIKNFYIADNGSNDGSSQLLMALNDLGIINRIYFPTVGGKAPQIPAYEYIINQYKEKISFIGFIDADEFIQPESESDELVNWLNCIYDEGEVSAIGFNWAIYGSSNRVEAGNGLVIERFKHRAEKSTGVNTHIKSFVRADRYLGFHSSHSVNIRKGRFVNTNKQDIELKENNSYSLSSYVCWSKFRINHYVIKSWEEYKNKKQARGRATTSSKRNDKFFSNHDLNDVYTDSMEKYVSHVNEEINKVKGLISNNTNYYSEQILCVDTADKDRIKGWCFGVNDNRTTKIRVLVNNDKEYIIDANQKRNDVLKHKSKDGCVSALCGFELVFEKALISPSNVIVEVYGVEKPLTRQFDI